MRILRLYILDDEPPAVARLKILLDGMADVELVGSSNSALAGLEQIVSLRPDVILIDVRMPFLTGMDLPRRLPPEYVPILIYVTAYEEFAVQAFELAATDYLLKPTTAERLRRALERARSQLAAFSAQERAAALERLVSHPALPPGPDTAGPRYLWVSAGKSRQRIALSQIDRLEGEREYIRIHCADRSYLMRHGLSAMADQLAAAGFIRVHRSVVVNTAYVKGLRKKPWGAAVLEMTSGVEVPVGPSYVAAVRTALEMD